MRRAILDPSLRARLTSVAPLPGVRAGSALVWWAGRLLVVQDDALAFAWVDPRTLAVEHVVLEGHGAALAKADKPDFESAFAAPDGTITLLGCERQQRSLPVLPSRATRSAVRATAEAPTSRG